MSKSLDKEKLAARIEETSSLIEQCLKGLDTAIESLVKVIDDLPQEQDKIFLKKSLSNFFDSMESSIREARSCLKSSVPNITKNFIV